jgi:UDPglucose 6-dehydrogenase
MKIIIAGYGFVGKAVASSIDKNNTVYIVDPKLGEHTVENFPDADGVVICVGTPSDIFGDCDTSQISSVMDQVPNSIPVLIKCTVRPDYLNKLIKDYPDHKICCSPEFLRAATANEDFLNQENMILGGDDPDGFWHNLFRESLPKLKTVFYCTVDEAAMMKYAINSFLSVKVTFFNQLYDLCQAGNIDYATVVSLLQLDDRIGRSHMQVPGPDGSRGFGGACFPKDTNAFIQYADKLSVSNTLVESAIKYNKKIRKTLT